MKVGEIWNKIREPIVYVEIKSIWWDSELNDNRIDYLIITGKFKGEGRAGVSRLSFLSAYELKSNLVSSIY